MQYSDSVWDHFTRPRNSGVFAQQNSISGSAYIESNDKSAIIKLQIKVDQQHIIDSRFQAFGCGSTIACGSWLSDWVIGKTLTEAKQLRNSDVIAALQLEPLKVHCAVLAEQVLKTAVEDFINKQVL